MQMRKLWFSIIVNILIEDYKQLSIIVILKPIKQRKNLKKILKNLNIVVYKQLRNRTR